ncbi:MAG: sensor domain-containing diguanylate cyclase [Nitrospirota bacterium]
MTVRHVLVIVAIAWAMIALGALAGLAALFVRSGAVIVTGSVAGLAAIAGGLAALSVIAIGVAARRLSDPMSRALADRWLDTQRSARELERSHKEFAIIARYADACTKFQDSTELYRNLTRHMAQAVGAGLCVIMRYEKSSNKMVAQAPGYGIADDAIKATQYAVTPEVKTVWNFSTQGSLLSNDPQGDRRVLREIANGLGLYNCLVVPFFFQGRVTGLIVAANKPQWFTYDEVRMLSAFSSYTSLAVANQQLQHEVRRTIRDGLTGLYTAHYFRSLLDQMLAAHEPGPRHLSVIAVAIDDFQSCLDLYGRAGADRIVKEVAALLSGYIGSDGHVARYGAQEFMVLFLGGDRDDPATAAEGMRGLVEEHPVAVDSGIPFAVTVSLGVASAARESVSSDTLLHAAQRALRRAIQSGKNHIATAGVES